MAALPLTSLTKYQNTVSTFSPVLALHQKYLTPNILASFCPQLVVTFLSSLAQSFLFETRTTTPSLFSLRSFIHSDMLRYELRSVTEYTRMMPIAPLQQARVIVRYFSWPAVSQICRRTREPSHWVSLNLKSMPKVDKVCDQNRPSQQRRIVLVLPTPTSPTTRILASRSQPLSDNMDGEFGRIFGIEGNILYSISDRMEPVKSYYPVARTLNKLLNSLYTNQKR